jgi:hypothetical protein
MATQIVLGAPSKLRVAPFAGSVMMMTHRPGFILKASATLGAAEDGHGAAFAECRVYVRTADRDAAQADVDKMTAALAEGRSVFIAPNQAYSGDEPLQLTAVKPWSRGGKGGIDLQFNAHRDAVVLSRSERVNPAVAVQAPATPLPVAEPPAAVVEPVQAAKATRGRPRKAKVEPAQVALALDAI